MKNLNLLGLLLMILTCFSCSDKTKINSQKINDINERIEKLKPEIKTYSKILDAEFDLFNVNGFSNAFTFVPGGSSSDYKFVVKVNPKDIPAWTSDLQKTEGDIQSEEWVISLTESRKNNWKTASEPVFFKRENSNAVTIIVFAKEGIIYKHISQLD